MRTSHQEDGMKKIAVLVLIGFTTAIGKDREALRAEFPA